MIQPKKHYEIFLKKTTSPFKENKDA